MKFKSLEMSGLVYLEPKVFSDCRGHFLETYNDKVLTDILGHKIDFVQDNQSYSIRGVLRGLHYQESPFQQGKLVRVIKGKIFDVAVDLRSNSKTFGKWTGLQLSGQKNDQLWIPEGFAHGFLTMSKTAIVAYKCTRLYSPKHEKSLRWDDPILNIKWPTSSEINISEKDNKANYFSKSLQYF